MAGAERPPSEQGIEYRTLDALEELARKVQELAERPPIMVPAHGNWWDVLPDPGMGGRCWTELLMSGFSQPLYLPSSSPNTVVVRAATYADRLELSLQVNGRWIPWQRALFFERPMAGAA